MEGWQSESRRRRCALGKGDSPRPRPARPETVRRSPPSLQPLVGLGSAGPSTALTAVLGGTGNASATGRRPAGGVGGIYREIFIERSVAEHSVVPLGVARLGAGGGPGSGRGPRRGPRGNQESLKYSGDKWNVPVCAGLPAGGALGCRRASWLASLPQTPPPSRPPPLFPPPSDV